jgi:hypothetical protein
MPMSAAGRARFQNDPEDPRHGTLNGYANGKCRCPKCLKEGRAYHRGAANYNRHVRDTPERVHGTYNGYANYRCRCDACITAADAARKTWPSRKPIKGTKARRSYYPPWQPGKDTHAEDRQHRPEQAGPQRPGDRGGAPQQGPSPIPQQGS